MKLTAQACGKIILIGEHAVVYGVPGLCAGIERGVTVTATVAKESSLTFASTAHTVHAGDGSELGKALGALMREGPSTPLAFRVETELQPGGGLGCSAAIGVALGRIVESERGEPDDARVLARANAWENIFHGNPSGIDTAAALHGSVLRFEKGRGTTPLEVPVDLWFAVGYSGTSASTKQMVEGIARIKERRPKQIDLFLEAVSSLTANAALAIKSADVVSLGKLLDMNQMLLAGLMLSTESIQTMVSLARDNGALGAKLTGSGGGGSVIALAQSAEDTEGEVANRIVAAWKSAGFDGFAARVTKNAAHAAR